MLPFFFYIGVVYSYLASSVGRCAEEGAFRALSRGFIHWQFGRIDKLEINIQHPLFCHVRLQMKPSIRQGTYHVNLLLGRNNGYAPVLSANVQLGSLV